MLSTVGGCRRRLIRRRCGRSRHEVYTCSVSYSDSERLPIEDLDAGLYIHRDDPGRRMPGIKVTTISDPDGMTQYLVDAVQFMEIQLERDNYRRALALINAWRLDP